MITQGINLGKYIKAILISAVIVILVSSVPVYLFYSPNQIYSFASGLVISLFNAMMGYFLNTAGLKKSNTVFMAYVFGGMGLRMMFIVICLLLLIAYSGVDKIALISSVIFFYFLFISIEIYFLNKTVFKKPEEAESLLKKTYKEN